LVPSTKPKQPVKKKPSNLSAPSRKHDAPGRPQQQQQGQQQQHAQGPKGHSSDPASRKQHLKDAAAASDSDRPQAHEQISTSARETATSSGRGGRQGGRAGPGSRPEPDEAGCLSDTSEVAAKKLKKLRMAEARWGAGACRAAAKITAGGLLRRRMPGLFRAGVGSAACLLPGQPALQAALKPGKVLLQRLIASAT
jgi:hypothetical protein